MIQKGSRLLAAFLLVVSAGAMLTASFDAEARRMGGGRSFGKQSGNVMKQRQAVKPPVSSSAQRSAVPAAGAKAGAAGAAAKSGMSRWLGPLAGIAAGLGIAALLSSLGLSGAFLEFMSSLLLIGLVVFGVIFLVRKLRGGMARPAMQQSGHGGHGASPMQRQGLAQQDRAAAPSLSAVPVAAAPAAVPAPPVDESWFIPGDFDTATFLGNAKGQFIKIQSVWDSGNLDELRDYMTDDLIAEVKPELMQRDPGNVTEVVLLNAELLGIETVSGGHLASVRYSGMLRESPNTEAFRFEEVWNLYKAEGAGWLLAGIQQIPLDNAS